MRRGVAAAVVVVAVAAAGCASNAPGDLTAAAERVLVPEVQHVREVAATGNYARLVKAVAHLKTLVVRERNAGQLTAARSAAIMDAADTLLQDASPSPSPSSSSPSPSPSPTSSSPSPSPTPSSSSPSATPTSSSPTESAAPSSSRSVVVSLSPGPP